MKILKEKQLCKYSGLGPMISHKQMGNSGVQHKGHPRQTPEMEVLEGEEKKVLTRMEGGGESASTSQEDRRG